MKKLYQDYQESRQPSDDFLYWFLVRKLNLVGKLIFALVLWVLWLKYCFNLRFMVFFFEFVFVAFVGYLLFLLVKKVFVKLIRND